MALSERGLGRRGSGASGLVHFPRKCRGEGRIERSRRSADDAALLSGRVHLLGSRALDRRDRPPESSRRHAPLPVAPRARISWRPAWLIGNVRVAYHVVLDLGAVAFSAGCLPGLCACPESRDHRSRSRSSSRCSSILVPGRCVRDHGADRAVRLPDLPDDGGRRDRFDRRPDTVPAIRGRRAHGRL